MIQVDQLSRHYGQFVAVDDVKFKIKRGEVVGLLGHNGAGKTTIMKMLTGFLEPTRGCVKIDDLDMQNHKIQLQQRIGYLPENCPVWPEMTVIDYLEYQAHLRRVDVNIRRSAVAEAIRKTALGDKALDAIQTLSRGYRQRVGVAQAILHKPDIIILDEPTNGLDPTQILQMRELIKGLAESATVILSTHILQEVQAVCERVLIMRQGKLVVDSKIGDLQKINQVLLTTNNKNAAVYLSALDVVKRAQLADQNGPLYTFRVDCSKDALPRLSEAIHKAGDHLYRLEPEVRNLETVFADVNNVSQKTMDSYARGGAVK